MGQSVSGANTQIGLNVPALVAAEAQGDASNLKGTDYHLRFAIWLLVSGRADSIHFFAGNDLLAQPSPPAEGPDEQAFLHVQEAPDRDVWMQLKCTASPWTSSALLDDNLLENFIGNSLVSEEQGRNWVCELVTTADIRADDILDFVEAPDNYKQLNDKLGSLSKRLAAKLASLWPDAPDEETLRGRGLMVLRQIATCKPLARDALNAQITCELAFRLGGDRQLTHEAQRKLIGALLLDTSPGHTSDRKYDRDWLGAVVGENLWKPLALDISAADACKAQVASRLPPGYVPIRYVPRQLEPRILEDFLRSSATVCLLTGRSGTGKSVMLAHWADADTSAGKARLLLPGDLFDGRSSLVELIAGELRPLTALSQDDYKVAQRLILPSRVKTFGPLLVCFDDVPVRGDSADFARYVAALVDQARKLGIKLLFACQSDVVANLQLFSRVRSVEIFQPQQPLGTTDAPAGPAIAFDLEDYSDDELRHALSLRLDPQRTDQVFHTLRDPALSILRNPYALDAFLENGAGHGAGIIDPVANVDLASLLDRRIDQYTDAAAVDCGQPSADVREVLDLVTEILWRRREERLPYIGLHKEVETRAGSAACVILDALRARFLRLAPSVSFSDAKIGARLYACRLHQSCAEAADLEQQLNVDRDHDVLVQLFALSADPVNLATLLAGSDARWIAAAAEGLARCNPQDGRIGAALVALARRERRTNFAVSALARFAIRSDAGRKELLRKFLSPFDEERQLGVYAMWHACKYAPDLVARAIRLQFRVPGAAPSSDKGWLNWRHRLARSLEAASPIDSAYAAREILAALEKVAPLALQPPPRRASQDEDVEDPLKREYHSLRMLAIADLDPPEFENLLRNLTSTDLMVRRPVVQALELVATRFPERIKEPLCAAIRAEQDESLLAALAWDAARLGEIEPQSVLAALKANLATCWRFYDSAAAGLGLLEVISKRLPQEVLPLLDGALDSWSEEPRLILSEIELVCRYQCEVRTHANRPLSKATTASKAAVPVVTPANELYRLRADIVRTLLRMGKDIGLEEGPQILRMRLRGQPQPLYTADLSDWIKGSEHGFASHPEAATLARTIIAAAQSYHDHPADVLDPWRRNLRYLQIKDCLDVLVALTANSSSPAETVSELPGDWERLYVARRLLDDGATSEQLIDLALKECESHRNQASGQASHERTECLVALQRVAPHRVPRAELDVDGLSWFFGGDDSAGTRFAAQIDNRVSTAVEQLEAVIANSTAAMVLHRWHQYASTWQAVLISGPYSRMFLRERLLPEDAKRLCKAMLDGLDGLPPSPAVEEHRLLYGAILKRIAGEPVAMRLEREAGSLVAKSHQLATDILSLSDSEITEEKLRALVADPLGWFENYHFRWDEEGKLRHGWGVSYYLIVFFPAVRLALCAAGMRIGTVDPGFVWMAERTSAVKLTQEIGFNSNYAAFDKGKLKRDLEAAVKDKPDQDSLWAALGHLQLLAGELDEAKGSLEKALKLKSCSSRDRGAVLYNLACVFARKHEVEECQKCLMLSKELKYFDVTHASSDPDLDSIRTTGWFQELIKA